MTSSPKTRRRVPGTIATGLFALLMTFSGGAYLLGAPFIVMAIHHLGYPDYFRPMLGVAKLLGVAALLAGGRLPRSVREWAYAGFTIDLVAATISHFVSGDGAASLPPLVALGLLAASYMLWFREPSSSATAHGSALQHG